MVTSVNSQSNPIANNPNTGTTTRVKSGKHYHGAHRKHGAEGSGQTNTQPQSQANTAQGNNSQDTIVSLSSTAVTGQT
ncbi:MAG: hypothetical protein HQK89_11750 [Nitrospirae bacterium]|nr:hypothetical protein [Nitrospirota bacterium]